jgi:hypothetical protein
MKEQTRIETSDRRWIAASGLVFVAAWIVGLALTSSPAATASTTDLVAYYQAHRGMAMLQAYLTNGLTGITLIVFAAALRSALRSFEGASSTLSSIIFGAGLVVASLSCLEALFALVLANHIAATRDGAVIQTLLDLNVEIDTFKLFVLGIMIGTTSLLASRVRVFPRWLVWVGIIEALLLLVASWGSPFENSALTVVLYVSGIGLLIWTAAVSIVMGWRGRAAPIGAGLAAQSNSGAREPVKK